MYMGHYAKNEYYLTFKKCSFSWDHSLTIILTLRNKL